VNGKEDMRGQRHSGEGLLEFWGKEAFWRLGTVFSGFVFFWFGVWVDCYRGASVAGSFGLGGQESSRNPGAREPDRLCS
jgi:hypothetical protein